MSDDEMNSELSSIISDDNCMEISKASTIQSDMFRQFNEYRLQNHLCDVTFVVDGQNLYGHRKILNTKSLYFENMFKSGMLESTLGVVNMKDTSYEIMDQIINFIYTGKLTLTIENAQSVISAAHYFLMTDLVEECSKYFMQQLTVDNCLSIRKLLIFVESNATILSSLNNYVISYFPKIVKADTFLQLEIDDFIEILSLGKTFDCVDLDINECGARWLKYDVNRNIHSERVQQCTQSFAESKTGGGWLMVFPQGRELNDERCAKLYDPVTNKWIDYKSINVWTKPSNKILVDANNLYVLERYCGTIEMKKFNFNTKIWTQLPSLFESFAGPAITIHKNKMYFCGGFEGWKEEAQASCHIFDLKSSEWVKIPSMLQKRKQFCVAAIGKYIYACGGINQTATLASVERFDTDVQRWEWVQSMSKNMVSFKTTVFENKLYSLGCDANTHSTKFEMFDPKTNAWTQLTAPDLTDNGCLFNLIATQDGIYALEKKYRKSAEIVCLYDVKNNKWIDKSGMNPMVAAENIVAVPIFPYDL